MDFSEGKNLHRSSRKMWPAIIISEGASVEEDFGEFKVCNKDTFYKMVSMLEKLDSSNPECEVRKMWKSGAMEIKGL
jgi:hypothetical protein